jgi:hypothetical protein
MRLVERTGPKNPLDAAMTKTQVVRRKFKSALPRSIQNRELSKMEAMARTMELFDRLRNMMEEAGLDKNDAYAGLVYYQPETKGEERVLARTIPLPRPEDIGSFANEVMALDKPRFLGVLFLQHDPATDKAKYQDVLFALPFMLGAEAEGRLLAARTSQQMGGFKKTAH